MLTQSWNSFLRNWASHGISKLMHVLVLTAVYTSASMMMTLFVQLNDLALGAFESDRVIAYLKDDVPNDDIQKVRNAIQAKANVKHVTVVSKEQSAHLFFDQMAEYAPDLALDPTLAALMPISLSIDLKTTANPAPKFLKIFVDEIRKIDGIADAVYGVNWLNSYTRLGSVIRFGALAFVTILAMGGLLIVINTITTSILSKREEIEILELVGASPSMVRAPFVFDGLVIGFLSSLAACLLSTTIFEFIMQMLVKDLRSLGLTWRWQPMQYGYMAVILVMGTVIGGIGAYFCVRRLNDGWLAAKKAHR